MTDGERTPTKNVGDARAFSEGHANFPRLGWTTFGCGVGTLFGAMTTDWGPPLAVFLIYGGIWVLWAMYLLSRRSSR